MEGSPVAFDPVGSRAPGASGQSVSLKIADTPENVRVRSSMITLEIDGHVYRVEFWPDRSWGSIPMTDRPPASRAHSGDGWFTITPITPPRPR